MTGKSKMNVDKICEGDIMSFTYYTKVKKVISEKQIVVCDLDDNDNEITITGRELIEKSFSADQFHTEEKRAPKTRVAEILVKSHNKPLTVAFVKNNGKERVVRGRLIKPEPLLGRSMVEDLDLNGDNRVRQVDHRTIKYLIVDGVKYTVN